MRIEIHVLPGDHAAAVGRYHLQLDKPGGFGVPRFVDSLEDVPAPFAVYFGGGAVAVFNAIEGRYVGTVTADITVGHLGKIYSYESVTLYDGAGWGTYPGAESPPAGTKNYLTPVPDTPGTAAAGSGRMHSVDGQINGMAPTRWIKDIVSGSLRDNLKRPVHMFDTDGRPIFYGPKHTPYFGYDQSGGFGSPLYGCEHHFGRPKGKKTSPWKPVDHLHFNARPWLLLKSASPIAHMHGEFLVCSMKRQFIGGHNTSPRSWGPMLGALAASTQDEEDIIDNMIETATDARANVEPGSAWIPYIPLHENRDDHIQHGVCSWQQGQLVIGAIQAESKYPKLTRELDDPKHGIIATLLNCWGHPENGFHGDAHPDGETMTGGPHMITGVFREYVLPALAMIVDRWERYPPTTPETQEMFRKANARWLWLAYTVAKAGYFGSSIRADKGWASSSLDEFKLTCAKLEANTPEGVKTEVIRRYENHD